MRLGQNPFHATSMYYPFGVPLYFHTFNLLNGILSLPLQICCGTTVAYNMLDAGAFLLAALGAYALVWHLTRRRAAAGIAGLIYGFSPYMAFHLYAGQPFMMMAGWLPLYLLALLKGLRERWWWSFVAGLLLCAIALTDWHYVVFALTITGVVAVYEAVRCRRLRAWVSLLVRLALTGIVFAGAISPVLVPMLAETLADPYATRPLTDSIMHSTDLLAFILPSPFHPVWGAWASHIFFGHLVPVGIVGGMASLGFVAPLLALYALVRDRRRSMLFALIFVVAFVLALGPYLQVDGINSSTTAHPIPLPYLLFHRLPFMNILRIPSRFVAMVMLGLAVLAGLGVAALSQHSLLIRRFPRSRNALVGVLALLILVEYWPGSLGTLPVDPPRSRLSTGNSVLILVTMPWSRSPTCSSSPCSSRCIIGSKPLAGGSHGRSCIPGSMPVSSGRSCRPQRPGRRSAAITVLPRGVPHWRVRMCAMLSSTNSSVTNSKPGPRH